MYRFSRSIKQKRNVRVLVAAAFLALMFADLGSHVVLTVHGPDSDRAWSLCGGVHEVPSADCPHKRNPFGPQQIFSDDASHQLVLLSDLTVPVRVPAFASPPSFNYGSAALSRSLEPPFYPPKHS